MGKLCYRQNTINVSQLHMKNITWHKLICLPIETPLNRLQTSCSVSAVHRLGRCHLFVHTSLYLFVGRQTAAGATLCYSQYLYTAKQLKSEQVTLNRNFTFHWTSIKSSNCQPCCHPLQKWLTRCVFLRLNFAAPNVFQRTKMWI